jgi:hypothetical protein
MTDFPHSTSQLSLNAFEKLSGCDAVLPSSQYQACSDPSSTPVNTDGTGMRPDAPPKKKKHSSAPEEGTGEDNMQLQMALVGIVICLALAFFYYRSQAQGSTVQAQPASSTAAPATL